MDIHADNLWDLFHDKLKLRKLSCGVDAIDNLMGGGICAGELTEVNELHLQIMLC